MIGKHYSINQLKTLFQGVEQQAKNTLFQSQASKFFFETFSTVCLKTVKYLIKYLNQLSTQQTLGKLIDEIYKLLADSIEQYRNQNIFIDVLGPHNEQKQDVDDEIYHFMNTRNNNIPAECFYNYQNERQRKQLQEFVANMEKKKNVSSRENKRSLILPKDNNFALKIARKATYDIKIIEEDQKKIGIPSNEQIQESYTQMSFSRKSENVETQTEQKIDQQGLMKIEREENQMKSEVQLKSQCQSTLEVKKEEVQKPSKIKIEKKKSNVQTKGKNKKKAKFTFQKSNSIIQSKKSSQQLLISPPSEPQQKSKMQSFSMSIRNLSQLILCSKIMQFSINIDSITTSQSNSLTKLPINQFNSISAARPANNEIGRIEEKPFHEDEMEMQKQGQNRLLMQCEDIKRIQNRQYKQQIMKPNAFQKNKQSQQFGQPTQPKLQNDKKAHLFGQLSQSKAIVQYKISAIPSKKVQQVKLTVSKIKVLQSPLEILQKEKNGPRYSNIHHNKSKGSRISHFSSKKSSFQSLYSLQPKNQQKDLILNKIRNSKITMNQQTQLQTNAKPQKWLNPNKSDRIFQKENSSVSHTESYLNSVNNEALLNVQGQSPKADQLNSLESYRNKQRNSQEIKGKGSIKSKNSSTNELQNQLIQCRNTQKQKSNIFENLKIQDITRINKVRGIQNEVVNKITKTKLTKSLDKSLSSITQVIKFEESLVGSLKNSQKDIIKEEGDAKYKSAYPSLYKKANTIIEDRKEKTNPRFDNCTVLEDKSNINLGRKFGSKQERQIIQRSGTHTCHLKSSISQIQNLVKDSKPRKSNKTPKASQPSPDFFNFTQKHVHNHLKKQKLQQYIELIKLAHMKFCGNKCQHIESIFRNNDGISEQSLLDQLTRLIKRK